MQKLIDPQGVSDRKARRLKRRKYYAKVFKEIHFFFITRKFQLSLSGTFKFYKFNIISWVGVQYCTIIYTLLYNFCCVCPLWTWNCVILNILKSNNWRNGLFNALPHRWSIFIILICALILFFWILTFYLYNCRF